MIISQIVAVSTNNVIGVNNGLPWHMPTDMAYFRMKTWGHHIVMGRKNYEAEGNALPGRKNIVLTRNNHYSIPDGIVVNKIDDAIEIARKSGEKELFIVGGEEIYKLSIPFTDRVYLTKIHTEVNGDTYYPELDMNIWQQVSIDKRKADEQNLYDYHFIMYERKDNQL